MTKSMEGKVAMVTGGSSGIGQATALALAREGARVVAVADLNLDGLKQTIRQIKEEGGEAAYFQTDVTQSGEVERLVGQIVGEYGRLDCAFNNAGTEGELGFTADCSEENWQRVMNVNLNGVWYCMKVELRQMLQQGSGVIVNNSSALGLVGIQGYPAYVASKHAIAGLTKTAALEYATLGIRVNAICPGIIRTPLYDRMVGGNEQIEQFLISKEPIGRAGTPEEVAGAVLWLFSDAASYVTGHLLSVDGGAVAQ